MHLLDVDAVCGGFHLAQAAEQALGARLDRRVEFGAVDHRFDHGQAAVFVVLVLVVLVLAVLVLVVVLAMFVVVVLAMFVSVAVGGLRMKLLGWVVAQQHVEFPALHATAQNVAKLAADAVQAKLIGEGEDVVLAVGQAGSSGHEHVAGTAGLGVDEQEGHAVIS